jgi:hypothetical protein
MAELLLKTSMMDMDWKGSNNGRTDVLDAVNNPVLTLRDMSNHEEAPNNRSGGCCWT